MAAKGCVSVKQNYNMGYRSEIIVYQKQNLKETQLFELYKYLIEDGWSISSKWDNGAIQYSVNSGDWLEFPLNQLSEFEKILKEQSKGTSWITIMFNKKTLDRAVWLTRFEYKYCFELQIASNDEQELYWFHQFHNELINSINKLNHIHHIEWRTGYDNKIIKVITNLKHDGETQSRF